MRMRDPGTNDTYFCKLRRSPKADEVELGHACELTFSCYHRFQFLSRDRTRQWFVDALADARQELPFDLWAYVIMPDHVHVFVYPRSKAATISRIRSSIKGPVARKAIAFLEENAPEWLPRITVREGQRIRRRFWQPGGGYDRTAIKIETVHSMIDYIHLNPVRRNFVGRATEWEWSSARWYAGISPVLIDIDQTLPTKYEL